MERYWTDPDIKAYFVAKAPNERLGPWLVEELKALSSPLSVLDAGCGYGRNLAPFLGDGWTACAFDPCAEAIAHVVNHYPGVTATASRLEDWPYVDRRFDVAICDGVLHNLASATTCRAAIDYLAAALQPGGSLFLSVFTSDPPPGGCRQFGKDRWATTSGFEMTLLSPRAWLGLLGAAGLTIIREQAETFDLAVGTRANLTVLARR